MITIHIVASLDGFIARRDGRVDWLETKDEFAIADIPLHLAEVRPCKSGMVELRYEVRRAGANGAATPRQ